MQLATGLFALLAGVTTVTASFVTLDARDIPSPGVCGILAKDRGKHRPDFTFTQACSNLQVDCINKAKNTTYIWSKTSCVAAAVCESPGSIVQYSRCEFNNPQIPEQGNTTALSYNVYKEIVGPCADNGCGMTQQNFIDLVYRALGAINSTAWPESAEYVVGNWWNPVKQWANMGDSIPYANFNDYLHYYNVLAQ